MRCFVSVDLPKEIKDYLFDLQKKLRGKDAKVNWIAKSRLHLTLKFLGEIDEQQLEKVRERLKKIKLKSFKVSLTELGVFPNRNYIRVIFVGLKPEENIFALQREIDSSLLDIFSSDERFHAHLTLGRVKLVKDKNILIEKLNENISGSFEIKEFTLVKSVLSKDGPKYGVLNTYSLE